MIAAPPLAVMAGFFANSPDVILGAPRLTMIIYGGTLMVALMVWVLMWVARLMGAPQDKLASSQR